MSSTKQGIINTKRILAFAKAHPEINILDYDAVIDLLLKQAGF